MSDVVANNFADLVPVAKSQLKRIMLNSSDNKLIRQTCIDILEAAGAKQPTLTGNQIIISNSNVQLLLNVVKELQ